MSERPQAGDRVLVLFEATVLEVDDDDRVGLLYKVAYGEDGREWIWVPEGSVTLLPVVSPRPKVGDRVRYTYYTSSPQPDEDARTVRVGTIIEDDGSNVPFRIREDGTGYKHWAAAEDVTALPAQPERSDTELERRLRKLEQGIGQHSHSLIVARLEMLERQMASLRSLLHNAGNV